MEGEYDAHRVVCQGCAELALEVDGNPRKAAEAIWVTDGTPDGYEPDPRMFPDLSSSVAPRADVLPDPVGEEARAGDPQDQA